ncbi:phage scaffolding protein [Neokomagataea anthophila]|nr:phage scaffolding protein [Neokomagataea anthophila]
MMSNSREKSVSDDALRQALEAAQNEVNSMRGEMDALLARQDAMTRTHEEALLRVKTESNREVVTAALRAEAMRMGAHNPDDVVRLLDVSGVRRDDGGAVIGVTEALENARRERAYLFGEQVRPGVALGTTMAHGAPRPGGLEPFDARSASSSDYEARKWQFLARS